VLIYVMISMTVFIGICGLGVDIGRMYLGKSELQSVADAAARYAVRGMQTSSTPLATAIAHAAAVVADSRVDGSTPTLLSTDVVRGTFDSQTRTFKPDSTGDAVCVTVRQTFNRAGSVPLMMSMLTGNNQKEIVASAVARVSSTSSQIAPPASGNLWLSGMPDNTTTQNFRSDNTSVWDTNGTLASPKQRPLELNLSNLGIHPGDTIALEGITGTATWNNNSPSGSTNTADGDTTYLVANGVAPAASVPSTSSNGLSNSRAPIGAVMAVFLSDDAPNLTAAPTNLDFGSDTSRNYTSISPELKQVFYIGDGKRTDGEAQTIVVPPHATKVYFGMMDAWQWNDNVGNFQTKLYSTSAIHLSK
jgi:Flp pilus assembly protein TadG